MAMFNGQRNLITLAVVFALGLGGGAALVHFLVKPARDTRGNESTGARPSGSRVAARGRLEPAGGVINLAASGPDIVKQIVVREGQQVEARQELAILASRDLRKIETDLARAQLRDAEERRTKTLAHLTAQQKESDARIRQLETQGPIDVKLQESRVAVLERQYTAAESLLTRMRLARSYPQQELDQQELTRVQAEQELQSARALLAKTKEAAAVNLEVARAQREASVAGIGRAEAEVPLGSLQKGVDLAAEKLEMAVIRSPVKGTVLKVLAHEGEMVGNQPVFQVADTSVMVAVAEVYETDIQTVRQWHRSGKPVIAEIEVRQIGSGGGKFRGQVIQIGSMVAKNSIFSLDPRQDVDRRIVEVRIRLDEQYHKPAAEFINMQVDVTILDPQGPAPE